MKTIDWSFTNFNLKRQFSISAKYTYFQSQWWYFELVVNFNVLRTTFHSIKTYRRWTFCQGTFCSIKKQMPLVSVWHHTYICADDMCYIVVQTRPFLMQSKRIKQQERQRESVISGNRSIFYICILSFSISFFVFHVFLVLLMPKRSWMIVIRGLGQTKQSFVRTY